MTYLSKELRVDQIAWLKSNISDDVGILNQGFLTMDVGNLPTAGRGWLELLQLWS